MSHKRAPHDCGTQGCPSVITARLLAEFSVKSFVKPFAKCRPTGLAVGANGDYIIADYLDKSIRIYNKMGQLKLEFGSKLLKSPWNVVQLSNGCIAVTDPAANDIKLFSINGTYIKSLESGKHFQEPYGLTTNRKGQLLVADKGANCIYVQDSDGFMINVIKSCEEQPIMWPQYVAADRQDNVVISDYMGHSVRMLDHQGRGILQYGSQGIEDDQLICPEGVCTDRFGHVIIADNVNERIHLISSDGKLQKHIVTSKQGLESPEAVKVDRDGHLVVTEGTTGLVKLFQYVH